VFIEPEHGHKKAPKAQREKGQPPFGLDQLVIPKSHGFYTKIAKSAKGLVTSNSFFADLATFV
jgi:hypothetical protein